LVSAFTGLAVKMLEKGIRVNSVAPGPVWTPLIVSSYPKDEMNQFGDEVSLTETIY
jgi:NAD(P)-dependent dehydrogenase (short-subunit alcohol dehydrogenase family)